MRAICIRGLRISMRCSPEPSGAAHLAAWSSTELLPVISNRRSVRSPILDVAPSFCLPPVDFCKGVSPSQAAKSLALVKLSMGSAKARIAVALIGPIPGMVMSRRAASS